MTSGLAEATVKRWQPRISVWSSSVLISSILGLLSRHQCWRRLVSLLARLAVSTHMRQEDTCSPNIMNHLISKVYFARVENIWCSVTLFDVSETSYGLNVCRHVPLCIYSSVCLSVYILGSKKSCATFPTLHVSFEQEHNAWASHNFRGQTKASICPSAWHMLSQLITVSIKI